jgi:hypothetical protein
MDSEKVTAFLAELTAENAKIRGLESLAAVNEAAGVCESHVDGLAAETGETTQRYGPLVYSLRSIYSQLAQTRAMVDIPRLADWADSVIARISRELTQPEQIAAPAGVPSIPDGATEFVIFESLARPGFRVACYHMGVANELFGLDGKPRVPPDPTKWQVVAYTALPAGLDLIAPSAMALPGDEGLPDWNAAELPPLGESQASDQSAGQ